MKNVLNKVFPFVEIPDESLDTNSLNIEIIMVDLKNVSDYLYIEQLKTWSTLLNF